MYIYIYVYKIINIVNACQQSCNIVEKERHCNIAKKKWNQVANHVCESINRLDL